MADLVVGLAKSVVDGVLTKAQAAIEEEAKLRKSAQRDLVFITGEFQMMQSFLNVANAERIENTVVRTWVSQVRELAYDVEDCIEFVIHLDKSRATWWWLRVVPSCMAPAALAELALALDQAVDEIEQVKARVADVSKRNARYNLISDSGSKPAVLQQQQPASSFADGAGGVAASNMLAEARDTAKRLQGFGDLSRLITTKRNDGDLKLQVISVWGAAGDHGTTSVIRKAYNDQEICGSFECRAWVKLAHPFSPREFVRGFMAQAYANSSEQQGAATIGIEILAKIEDAKVDLFKQFEELVKKKYLVVLEDLSGMVEWDAARTFLPDTKNGSCIVVSAQQSEIASLCVGHHYQILELKQFSPDHSVCALFEKGSLGDDTHNKGKTALTREESHDSSSYGDTLSPNEAEAEEWMKNNSPLIGRGSQMNELRKYPARARTSSNPVMAVWGVAGVGKSTVVRDLYYGRMQEQNQFDRYGWVEVSQPFNLRELCLGLLAGAAHPAERYPVEYCHRLVHDCRCLLVIDGLRSKEEWDLIQAFLVPRDSRSVIVVVTTEASVARYCTNNEDHLVFNVKALETAAAVDLFESQVQKRNPNSTLKVHGVEQVEDLVRRCGGLPKVIAAIAVLMATRTVTLMETVCSLNRRFMHHLETKQEYDSLRDLFRWMDSYFRTCPDSLKPCIIYLAIFPRDHTIRRRRLVRRWVAEGYSRDGHNESAEEIGEDQFSELLQLSIIQQPPASMADDAVRMVRCQVNGFIREYVVSRQMKENLVFELGGRCGLTTQRTGRHLVVLADWTRDRVVFESTEFSRLRSLTVFGQWKSFFVSESMKMLRVLDLEDAEGHISDSDLDRVVELLHRLKFLSLRGHAEITRLPASLGHLRHLQSLDVRGTSITSLPGSIVELDKLQYVRAGGVGALAPTTSWYLPGFLECRRRVGVEVPRRSIGKLTALHTLGVVNVGASGGKAMVKELKKLTQLRKLGASGINQHNSKKFFSAVSGYAHLESLSVQFDKETQPPMDADIVLPWKSIHSLKLYGLQDRLPLSKGPLPEDVTKGPPLPEDVTKLTKLNLEMATLKKNDMRFLAMLPNLCVLRLRVNQATSSSSMKFDVYHCGLELPTFKKVKTLEIACSSTLKLEFGLQTMKSLELLKLDCSLDCSLDVINVLAMLPKLCILRLRVNQLTSLEFDVQDCGVELPSFKKVKILEIACSSTLKLKFGLLTMKSLELLKLDCSLDASQLPRLDRLPELQEVLLKRTNEEATKTALQSQLVGHLKGPVVKYFDDEKP